MGEKIVENVFSSFKTKFFGNTEDETNQDVSEEPITLSIYIGGASYQVVKTGADIIEPPESASSYDLSGDLPKDVLRKLSPDKSNIKIRYVFSRPEVYFKVFTPKSRPLKKEQAKGFFSFIPPPTSIDSKPLWEEVREQDDFHTIVAMPVEPLRKMLESMSDKALTVESMVPLSFSALLAFKSGVMGDGPACIVYPDYNCTTVAIGSINGPFIIRSFLPGWESVVNGLIEYGIAKDEAINAVLTKREFFESSAYTDIVAPYKTQVKKGIDDTRTFYNDQLGGKCPESYLLCGYEKPMALLKADSVTFDPLALIAKETAATLPNLLSGTDEAIFKKGTVVFGFDSETNTFKEMAEPERRAAKPSRHRVKKPKEKKAVTFASLIEKFRNMTKNTGSFGKLFKDLIKAKGAKGASAVKLSGADVINTISKGLSLILILFFVYGTYKYFTLGSQYRKEIQSYESLHEDIDKLTHAIEQNKGSVKHFWTQKVLAIAKNLDLSLWVMDITVDESGKKQQKGNPAPGGALVKRILTIEGAALPSIDGHLKDVANFMEKLDNDTTFMVGISKIDFKGLSLEKSDDKVVHFTIDAIYEGGVPKPREKDNSKPDMPSLPETIQKTQEHNKQAEEVLEKKF
ncbi:hypothetical protein [Candidatus Magnetomonas plexicatena]|uniref:hypothetical protein n=1 Tax=Candidatus Magnetomonas plexicatena TaxID=2552947 RepID=UPI001C756420|nr:hypothetical protein E2O03_006795 [Nitrospirales bacterium LBB_01]